jgi:hypothetical protein
MARTTLLLLLAAALLLGACAADDTAEDAAAPDEFVDELDDEQPMDSRDVALGPQAEPADDAPAPAERPASDDDGDLALPVTTPAQPGDRIIKEGTVSVEVDVGEFDRAYAAVIDAAARHGGTVVSSTTRTGEDDRTSGSITVRVPVEAYEQLLVSVGDIGTVRARQITAQDVTTEFVDLRSRLRHLQAQERFFLELMDDAQVVGDAIAVNQHLQQVQQQMEQVQGRLQYLEVRTSYSTLTVELLEPGTEVARVVPLAGTRPSLSLYWERALDAFVNMVGALLVAGLFVAPLLIPAGVALLAWRALRRRPVAAAE